MTKISQNSQATAQPDKKQLDNNSQKQVASDHQIKTTDNDYQLEMTKFEKRMVDNVLLQAYGRKRKILKLSFWQGLFFGVGSALGSAVVLTFIIWLLSRMIDWFPMLGDFVKEIIEYMNK